MSGNRENQRKANLKLIETITKTRRISQADGFAWLGTGLALVASSLLEVADAIENSGKAKT